MARMTVSPLRRDQTPPAGSGLAARLAVRNGLHRGPTAGLAPGFVQGNLAILPQALAGDFMQFCQRNPKPCPLIGISAPGDARVPELGEDLDIRTDLPRYRVWKNGELTPSRRISATFWRDDLVSFVIGCSFSFEEALMSEGIELRHMRAAATCRCTAPRLPRQRPGPFHGPLVVSMRPLKPADAIRAVQITTRFPAVHGAPVHIGKPELIGIEDIEKPDYGDAVEVRDGRIAGVLGLRGDAAIGDRHGEAGVLHHALSRQHAGDRPQEQRICDHVIRPCAARFDRAARSVNSTPSSPPSRQTTRHSRRTPPPSPDTHKVNFCGIWVSE